MPTLMFYVVGAARLRGADADGGGQVQAAARAEVQEVREEAR